MKSLLVALIALLSFSAHAAKLTCEGIDPKSNQRVKVILDSSTNILSVNGEKQAAHVVPGPEDHLLAFVSQGAFVGISTRGYTDATINTRALDQVELKCDGVYLF